jgi:sarcosine oxidase
MSEHYDVIIIGVGGMGSAACYHLARRGHRVLGIEQFEIPHNKGSSHGLSRMIRSAYYEHSDYVPLLRRSFRLWRELQDDTLLQILYLTGGLYIGARDGELVAGSLASSRQHALPYELYDPDDLRRLFPQFSLPDDFAALYELDAGYVIPELAIAAHLHLAMRHGAAIHGNEPVLSWQSDARSASVTTARGTYHADQLIFTAGAWTGKLLTDLSIKLTPTRQILGWVQPLRREPFLLGTLPVWAIGDSDGSLFYGFPIAADSVGLKLARHFPGERIDPDTLDRTSLPQDEHDFRGLIKQHLPDADGPLISMRLCMYTMSPDHHFILDRHPQHERVTLAAGFSGHGFKFCPVIGEALADLAIKGQSDLPIGFLSLRGRNI